LETSERQCYVKNGRASSAQREENDHPTDPVPSGLIRRRFLAVLNTGSASLAARSARVLTSYVQGEEQGSQNGEKHEYIDPMFWSDCTDPERQTKKTKEQIAQEKAGRLARVKRILAASTRQDWEADGPRLWVHKGGDTELRIVDLTDDEGRVELKEEWARSAAGAGSVALRVELSICQGSDLLVKVPVVYVDSGRAFIPWPHEDEDGRLVVTRWQYDICRVISPGEYLGAYPVRPYLRRAGIVVI
jgi:hypothetical protein